MTIEEKLELAKKLLSEASDYFSDNESAPNGTWWKQFFILDGAHMILTEEGWESGEVKASIIKDCIENEVPITEAIRDEVNAPTL